MCDSSPYENPCRYTHRVSRSKWLSRANIASAIRCKLRLERVRPWRHSEHGCLLRLPLPPLTGHPHLRPRGHGLVLLHGDEARELLLPPLLELRGRHRGRHLPRRVPLRETARAPIHAPAATRSAPLLVSDVRLVPVVRFGAGTGGGTAPCRT